MTELGTSGAAHRINLKGPWEYQLKGGDRADFPREGTVKLPADWQDLFGDFRGRSVFRRHFNKPTNLDAHERVDLVLDGFGEFALISLNQLHVGSIFKIPEFPVRFDITSMLEPHNVLQIEVEWKRGSAAERGGLWAPVGLEIVTT